MNATTVIPKKIIQTGKTSRLTLREQAAVKTLACLNPDFEHLSFCDEDVIAFIDREYPEYRAVFDNFKFNIQRFDFFRYLAIYRLGGFYFDLDVFLARSLHDLTESGCVFPFEELTINRYLRETHHLDWEIGNYAFGAAPGHPFLGAIIENCVQGQKDPDWVKPMMKGIPSFCQPGFQVLNSTGPGMITRTLVENPQLARKVRVLFPDDVCDARSWHTFGNYGVHLMAASWRGRESYLRRKLSLLWESRRRRLALAESRKQGGRRVHPPAM